MVGGSSFLNLPLDCACRESADDLPVEEDVSHKRRDGDDEDGHEEQVVKA